MSLASGRRTDRHGTPYVVYTRTFAAPREVVWAAISDPERLGRWIGTWSGDPASGEVDFVMTAEGEDVEPERYRIEVCTPPRRLVVSAGGEGQTAWHLEIDLGHTDGVTTLTFAQSMDDVDAAADIGPGWDYYLDRLVAAERGTDADAVDWDDYYPALSDHYRHEFGTTSDG